MIEPRDFEPRESILSDDLKATRPRVPLKSLAGERKQGHRVDHEGSYPWQLWGCQGGVWGTCGGAARAGSPTKMQPREARPLSLPSGSEVLCRHTPDPSRPRPQGAQAPGTPRPPCQPIQLKSNDFPSALRAVAAHRKHEPGCARTLLPVVRVHGVFL